jgi:Zn-dependent alcohol dehydrogenase
VLAATGERGADVVLECSGAAGSVDEAIRMCKPAGRIGLVGFFDGPVTADLTKAVRRGPTLYTTRGEGNRAVGRCLALATQGRLQTAQLVTYRFPLEDIDERSTRSPSGAGTPSRSCWRSAGRGDGGPDGAAPAHSGRIVSAVRQQYQAARVRYGR